MEKNHFSKENEAPTRKQSLQALIALQFIEGLGNTTLSRIDSIDDPLTWLAEPQNRALFSSGLAAEPRKKLASFLRNPWLAPEWEMSARALEWFRTKGADLWLKTDSDFPGRLTELDDCPVLLYRQGNTTPFNKPLLAIVGARKPTHVGARFARELAEKLSELGFAIVSGMAAGIDAAAHWGALTNDSSTIAVWATGLDLPYPQSNCELAGEISEKGCILTEMPLGTQPLAGCFPRRNRIVAGLCEGVIVVEAGEKSGSMITARLAMEQNREVFAVPGTVYNPQAKGCHQLLREGACLVAGVEDVIDNLSGFVSRALVAQNIQSTLLEPPELSSELEEAYLALSEIMEPYELILSRSPMSSEALATALVDLELMGLIVADAGCYARK